MAKSIKVNFIFNLINTITGVLFPLIAFPYASRVLFADGIGKVNFFQSIIQYLVILSSLGIPMYAIREIAKIRDNIAERNKTLLEILLLSTFLTMLGYVLVAVLAFTVAKIQADIPLFLILSVSIFLTTIGCEWFFQGIEDFQYITIRGIIVKTLSLIMLFFLVKTKEDIKWYAIYTVVGTLGGNVLNFFRLRKYVSFNLIRRNDLKPFKHLKPALRLFALNIIISIYINLNSLMLGFIKDNESVGLFTAATKLTQVLLAIIGSLGTVLLPRLSNMLANNDLEDFRALAQKSMTFVLVITIPITVGLMMTAGYLIPLFCGDSYKDAVPTLIIISPIIIFIGMSNVLGIQILYPQGRENIVIFATALGAATNLILNIWLIPRYSQNGAAVATFFAELLVTASMILIGKRKLPIKWENNYWNYIIGSILMGLLIYLLKLGLPDNMILSILSLSAFGVLFYIAFLILLKDPFYLFVKNIILKKLKKSEV